MGLNPEEVSSVLKKEIEKFIELPEEEARLSFNLGVDSRDWKVLLAQEDVAKSNCDNNSGQRPSSIIFVFHPKRCIIDSNLAR